MSLLTPSCVNPQLNFFLNEFLQANFGTYNYTINKTQAGKNTAEVEGGNLDKGKTQ